MAVKIKPRDKVKSWVKKQIDDHILSQGDNIPSERYLSKELGVSRTAVRAAIDDLETDGVIVSNGRGRLRKISKGKRVMEKKKGFDRKLFGTDGIRGTANEYPIVPEVALRVGKAIASEFRDSKHNNVVLGKDTRLSGYMLETALTSGLVSMGMNVLLVGPVTTPAVAHLTKSMGAAVGIMLTASHNPYTDNGIKIFGSDGYKLSDEHEYHIESMILDEDAMGRVSRTKIGKALRIEDARGRYIEFAKTIMEHDVSLDGLKVVLDCANGSGYFLAPLIFKELGAEVIKLSVHPDGYNINEKCGATYPEKISKAVIEHNADVGIALDGDADRVIFCDANGKIVDGDKILAMCAIDMHNHGKLADDTLVVTTMSNIGLHIAMKEHGIKTVTTDVGDRYVIEAMRKEGYNLGGEQSGHIIFGDFATTGDGIVSALKVLELMNSSGESLEELSKCMRQYPQTLVSLPVTEKKPIEELKKLNQEIYKCHTELGDQGRTVIRYSGTENKIRLLVESADQALTDKWIKRLKDAVLEEIG